MEKGLNANLPVVTAGMLGVITATGGGLLRDLLTGEVPQVLRPGRLILTASIVGASTYAVFDALDVSRFVSVWIVIGTIIVLRLASEYFGWTTPEAGEVSGRVANVSGTVLAAPVRLARTQRPATMRFGRRQGNDRVSDATSGQSNDEGGEDELPQM
jgi:hypothetical protein